MEVIGGIASIGAILNGAQKTVAILRSLPGIEDDWRRLNDEVDCLVMEDFGVLALADRVSAQIKEIEILIRTSQSQYPIDQANGPEHLHLEPIHRAIERLKQILRELETLIIRSTKEQKEPKDGGKGFKPDKLKWLYLREDIANIHNRLRDTKIDLNLALRLADGYVSPVSSLCSRGLDLR